MTDPQATPDSAAAAAAATIRDRTGLADFDVVALEQTFGGFTAHGTDHLDLATFPEQLRRLRAVRAVGPATRVVPAWVAMLCA